MRLGKDPSLKMFLLGFVLLYPACAVHPQPKRYASINVSSIGTTGEITGNLADINLAQNVFHRQFTDHLDTSAVNQLPDMREVANDDRWKVAA